MLSRGSCGGRSLPGQERRSATGPSTPPSTTGGRPHLPRCRSRRGRRDGFSSRRRSRISSFALATISGGAPSNREMSRLVDVTYPPIHERRQRVETVGLWELDDCSKQLLVGTGRFMARRRLNAGRAPGFRRPYRRRSSPARASPCLIELWRANSSLACHSGIGPDCRRTEGSVA